MNGLVSIPEWVIDPETSVIDSIDQDPTTTIRARALADELVELGFADGEAMVARHGIDAVDAALARLEASAPQVGLERGWTARRLREAGIRNAPGLVTAWLREPAPVRRPENEDPIAAQRQRFLGGPLGWVVRS